MSKYNTPGDQYDLIRMIQRLQDRVTQLERSSKPGLPMAFGINASAWADAGDYPILITSSTFTNTFYFPYVHVAPTPVVVFECVCSDSTTTGEYRLADGATSSLTGYGGATIDPLEIPANTTSATIFSTDQSPNYWDDFPIGTRRFIRLQVRRVTGTGTISIRANYLYQKSS